MRDEAGRRLSEIARLCENDPASIGFARGLLTCLYANARYFSTAGCIATAAEAVRARDEVSGQLSGFFFQAVPHAVARAGVLGRFGLGSLSVDPQFRQAADDCHRAEADRHHPSEQFRRIGGVGHRFDGIAVGVADDTAGPCRSLRPGAPSPVPGRRAVPAALISHSRSVRRNGASSAVRPCLGFKRTAS